MRIHTGDPICPGCEEKLKDAHPNFTGWFKDLKHVFQNAHIAWSFRGQEDQEKAYSEGESRLHFPNSAHNKLDSKGNRCARALDLFEIEDEGIALYSPKFFIDVNKHNEDNAINLLWGGRYKSLGDGGHFELPYSIDQP